MISSRIECKCMNILVKSVLFTLATTPIAAPVMANTVPATTVKHVATSLVQQKIDTNKDVQKVVKAKADAQAKVATVKQMPVQHATAAQTQAAKKLAEQKTQLSAKELKAKKAAEEKAAKAKAKADKKAAAKQAKVAKEKAKASKKVQVAKDMKKAFVG